MATVIDELIVKLGLDASGFKQGQQQATQSLNQFQGQATNASQNVFTKLGHALGRFFTGINAPIKASQTSLQKLGTQAQQTGNIVNKGGQTGATGLAALTAAGLGAFTVLKGIQEVAAKISTTMTSTAAFGRIAQWAGTNPQWLSQVATAAHTATNAPKEETTAALYGIQQDIENLALGRSGLSQRLKDIQRLGIDVISGTPEERLKRIVEELPKALQKLTLPQAIQQLGSLPPELVQFFKLGPGAVQNYLNQAGPISITKEQTEAAQRLQTALNKLADAWESLVRTLETNASPVLTKIADKLSTWNIQLQQTPSALKDVEVAVLALGTAIGLGLLAKLLRVIPALSAVVAGLQAIEQFTSHGLGGLLPENKTDRQLSEEARRSAEDVARQQERTKNMPWYQRMWENLKHSMGGEGASYEPPTADPRHKEALIRATAIKYGVDPNVAVRVARSEGLGTFSGDSGTSFGAFQLHKGGGLGDEFYKETGLDPSDPRNEDAGIDWAIRNLKRTGWTPYHGAAKVGVSADQGLGLAQATPLQYSQGLKSVQGAQAGATTNNSTSTSSNYDTDFNINVQTQPGADHYMIGDAVAGAIRRSTLSNQANVGLE